MYSTTIRESRISFYWCVSIFHGVALRSEHGTVIIQALQCLETWPLMNKNKVEDSQIFLPVEEFAMLGDEKVKKIAQRVCYSGKSDFTLLMRSEAA